MEVDGNQWKSVGVCTAARGSPYYYYVPMIFFWTFARFSPVPVGLFSCSRLRSSQGPACTPRYKFGFRTGSVARALGVQSREIWLGTHGVAFRGARAEQDNGKPTCQPLLYQHGNNNRFKLSLVLQLRTLLCLCGPLLYMCGNDVSGYRTTRKKAHPGDDNLAFKNIITGCAVVGGCGI